MPESIDINMLFTEYTEVGRMLMTQTTSTLKKFLFEISGNAPFIVFDDDNIVKGVAGDMVY